MISRNRFQSNFQFLHFADNSHYDPNDPNRDHLCKVRCLVEFLVNKFKTVYVPDQHISIDEELLLWKGNISFKQYIPTKKARFGMKMFSLCENSGYLWNSFVYIWAKNLAEMMISLNLFKGWGGGENGPVIPRLMETFLNKGYRLYV